MDILKEKTVDIFDKLNQKWVEAVELGEQSDGLDLSKMFGEFSKLTKDLDAAFMEAKERSGKKKKGGIFG